MEAGGSQAEERTLVEVEELDGGGRGLQPGRGCVPGTPALQELLRASQVEGGASQV